MSTWLDQAAPHSQGPRPRVRGCPGSNSPSPAGPTATESDSRRSACQTAVGIASLSAFSAPNTSANPHSCSHHPDYLPTSARAGGAGRLCSQVPCRERCCVVCVVLFELAFNNFQFTCSNFAELCCGLTYVGERD